MISLQSSFHYRLLLSCSMILLAFSVMAQHAGRWDQILGSIQEDKLTAAIPTPDGGYLLAGTSTGSASGDKSANGKGGTDFWLVKLDKNDKKQWDQTLGGPGDDILGSVIATADGGYLLAGTSASGAGGSKSTSSKGGTDYWIIKTDGKGNKQWDKTLGGSADETLARVLQTPEGGYLLAGSSDSDASGDKSRNSQGYLDYWIVKVGTNGNSQWDKTIGGNDNDALSTILATPDGGYLLAGSSLSAASGDKSEGNQGIEYTNDYWVVKIGANGNRQWEQTLGGNDNDELADAMMTADGGYLLAGTSFSNASGDKSEENTYYCDNFQGVCDPDYWVIKVDAQGKKRWDNTIGSYQSDRLAAIAGSTEGGYLLVGTSDGGATADKSSGRIGATDYWVVHISQHGRVVWDQTLGSEGNDYAGSILLAEDSYLVAGTSDGHASGDKRSGSKGGSDFWIIRQGLSVSTVSLIDAESDREVATLREGDVLNLALLGNRPLNFRANTFPGRLGSVRFVLEGSVQHQQTENYYPYALFGDEPGLDYHGKKLLPGTYTLTATPYALPQLKGKVGTPLTLHFTVEENITLEYLSMYIAGEGFNDLFAFGDGDTVDLAEFGDTELALLAFLNPRQVAKVKFELQGPISHVREDTDLPYSLFGDDSFGPYYLELEGRKWPPGQYSLTITPYSYYGPAEPITANFEIIYNAQVISLNLLNATTDAYIRELEDGDVIDLSAFKGQQLTVGASTIPYEVDQVRFVLEGPVRHEHTEKYLPYVLYGDKPGLDYAGKTWEPGSYSLTATPYLKGMEGTPYTIAFTVKGSSGARIAVEVYPVPAREEVTVQHPGLEEGGSLMLLDFAGHVLYTQSLGPEPATRLDLRKFGKGIYYLKIVSQEAVETRRLLVE